MMRNKLIVKCLPIVCLLASSLYANLVFAGWSDDQSQGYSNQRFGNFPPLDIDQQLQDNLRTQERLSTDKLSKESQSQDISASDSYKSDLPDSSYKQNSQMPTYGDNNRDRKVNSYGSKSRNKSRNKRRSGLSAPWGNNGSGFSAPWNNRGSSFSAPWDNNGSSFSFPWGNNGSGFSPWDNRRDR